MGLFTSGAIICGAKKRIHFFFRTVSILSPSFRDEMGCQSDLSLAAGAQKGKEWWRSKTSVNKTQKSIRERREWMPRSCYLWYLETDLFSHVLYIISINSALNYVIWSVRFLPRARVLSQSVLTL